MKEKLIKQIIDIEWPMFSSADNEGGKAFCQTQPRTFKIMRKSQYLSWTDEILESYLRDLKRAVILKRNLCAEKYAFMMEMTDPVAYQKIRPLLPEVSRDVLQKIQKIVDHYIAWGELTAQKYPALCMKGRPLKDTHDSVDVVSIETYLFCELKTYSNYTVSLLYLYILNCCEQGINLAEMTLENTIREYGYESLEEASQIILRSHRLSDPFCEL